MVLFRNVKRFHKLSIYVRKRTNIIQSLVRSIILRKDPVIPTIKIQTDKILCKENPLYT